MQQIGNTSFELIELCAWSDKSLADLRATWRGFYSYFLSTLLAAESHDIETIILASMAEELNDLKIGKENNLFNVVRLISMQLAKICGYPQEFGLAALFDWNPPTRVHQSVLKKRKKKSQQFYKSELTKWLKLIEELSRHPDFENHMQNWKILLEGAVATWLKGEDGTEEAKNKRQLA